MPLLSILYLMERLLLYPASGLRNAESGGFVVTGSYAYYWSSAVTGVYSSYLRYESTSVYPTDGYQRARGCSVRCVQYL